MSIPPKYRLIPVLAGGLLATLAVSAAHGQDHQLTNAALTAAALPPLSSLDAPPPMSRERLLRFANVLGLDADQTKAADVLYQTYTLSVQKSQKQMREQMRRLQEDAQDGDQAALETKLPEIANANAAQTGKLRDQFLSDLKSLLRPDQAGNWDKLDRLRRRDSWLSRGSLSGSNVDLIAIVDALKLTPAQRAPLATPLEDYAVDLDRPLTEREEHLSQNGSQQFDEASMKKFSDEGRQIDVKVRDVNQRYARQLAELLPDDKRGAFEELVKQQTFRRVYKDAVVAKRAAAAEKLPGLTDSQKSSISTALSEYQKNLQAANDRWAAAISKAEQNGQSPNDPFASMINPSQDPELVDARKARRDLDNSLRQQLDNVLTPDQISDVKAATADPGVQSRAFTISAVTDGSGPVTIVSQNELDEDEMGALTGMAGGAGSGMVIIQHNISNTGDGQDHHTVTITAPTPTPPKK